ARRGPVAARRRAPARASGDRARPSVPARAVGTAGGSLADLALGRGFGRRRARHLGRRPAVATLAGLPPRDAGLPVRAVHLLRERLQAPARQRLTGQRRQLRLNESRWSASNTSIR